jgi:hypothetical protein
MGPKAPLRECAVLAQSGRCLTYAPSVCGQLFANDFERRGNDAGGVRHTDRGSAAYSPLDDCIDIVTRARRWTGERLGFK